jgi:hypothetical protein
LRGLSENPCIFNCTRVAFYPKAFLILTQSSFSIYISCHFIQWRKT